MKRQIGWLWAMMVVVLLAGVVALAPRVQAQGGGAAYTLDVLAETLIPVRDAPALAERLGGIAGATALTVTPAPVYEVGDRLEFFVGNGDADEIFTIETELAAAAPGVYLWVEVGVPYEPGLLQGIANMLDQELFPAVRALFGNEPNPGIDGDPHIYIVNATGLGGIGGYFNDGSTYPQEVIRSSNEHEMFVIAVDNIPFTSPSYPYVLAHEFVHMIQHHEDMNEETWVIEGTAELGAFLTVGARGGAAAQFLADPTLQLNGWSLDNRSPHYGAAALFFSYLVDRFGEDFALAHSQEPADGIAGIDRALATLDAVDALTGEPVAFADVFADWLVANLINNSTFADGRFVHRTVNLGNERAALTTGLESYPAILQDRAVNQHGAQYILVSSEPDRQTPQTLTITFDGSEQVAVVPTEAHSGEYFYWANRADQSNTRLTRAFDLSDVEAATLRFWTWYEMEPFWDYAYLSASTDGGATWQVIETPNTTAANPNDRAFAAGLTGYSGSDGQERPAPFIGIAYDVTSGQVTQVVPDTAAANARVQVGDVLQAFNGDAITSGNLPDLLNVFTPGETITLTVERQGSPLDLPLTLGAHPERTLPPQAQWVEEVIDLTPFAGGEVLVRFEYVTDQAFTRNGWVIDDLSVPEIGYFDDAEDDSGGWTAEGWVRIANALPQTFAVQWVQPAAPGGNASAEPVQRWLMSGDGVSGAWTVTVGPDSPGVLIISGMTPYTTQPARYDLTVAVAE